MTFMCLVCDLVVSVQFLSRARLPYRMKILLEVNLATWIRMVRFTEFNINKFCFVEIQCYKLSLKDLWMFNNKRNLNRANSQLAKMVILMTIFFQYMVK